METLNHTQPEQQAKALVAVRDQEAQQVLTVAKAIVITTPEQYQDAAQVFTQIKQKIKDLEAQRTSITGPINASLKTINDMFRRPKEALEAALSYYERPMAAFQREERRKRNEAEEKARLERETLEREAIQKAEEEQKRLDEIRLQQQEAARQAEQAANPVAAFLAKQKVEALKEEEQETIQATTDAIRESAMAARALPAEYVPKTTAAGTRANTVWRFRVIDPALVPREFLMIDEKKLGEHARTMKEKAQVAGVEFFDEIKIGVR